MADMKMFIDVSDRMHDKEYKMAGDMAKVVEYLRLKARDERLR